MGLYQFHKRINFNEVFVRLIVSLVIGSIILVVAFYLVPQLSMQPRVAAIALIVSLLLLLVLRVCFMTVVDRSIFRRRTLVLGAGNDSLPISDLRRRADRRGFKIVGKVPAPGDRSLVRCEHLIDSDRSLLEIARDRRADEIVIAMDERRGHLPVKDLLNCKLAGIDVIDLMEFLERETGKIRIDLVNPGWLIFSEGFQISRTRRVLKRLFDLLVAGVALLLFWPVMLLIVLATKVTEGWDKPALYRQRRVGFRGTEFDVLKFRSMVVDAESENGAQWAEEDDPRVTKIGAILRAYRLDELPQIFNVLVGEMSVVGPRPERPEFVEDFILKRTVLWRASYRNAGSNGLGAIEVQVRRI